MGADNFPMRLRLLVVLGTFAWLAGLAGAKPFALLPWVTLEADETYWRAQRFENMRALALVGPSSDESATVVAYHAEKYTGSTDDYFARAYATLAGEYGRATLTDQGQLWTAALGPLEYRVWAYQDGSHPRFHVMYIFRSEFSLHRFEGMGAQPDYENLRGQMDAIVSRAVIDPLRQ